MREEEKLDSKRFEKVRLEHRSEVAEDYVELILDQLDREGRAKLTELATLLGVAHPTVAKGLRKLEKEGLVTILPYRSVELTKKGLRLAEECRNRHALVVNFFIALGVDKKTANHDAEGVEHHLSPKTLRAMEAFIKKNTDH